MTSEQLIEEAFATQFALTGEELWSRVRDLVMAEVPEGQLAGADEPARGFAWLRDILRSLGGKGREIWEIVRDPKVATQTQRLAAIITMMDLPAFNGWPVDKIVAALLFAATMVSPPGDKSLK